MSEPTPDSSSLIGRTIGVYLIQEEIGISRWGKVYRAYQSSVDRTVALRILSPEIADLPGKVEHFLETSRAEAPITHPHIVAVYEAGRVDGVSFCAMEYMDGPPLREFLRKGNVCDDHRLLMTAAGVARAMDFLWQRGHAHQPPMEKNILADNAETAKIINLEPVEVAASESPQEDILSLGLVIADLANELGGVTQPVGEFVERMVGATGRKPFASLAEVVEAAEALDRQLFPRALPPKPRIEKIVPKKTKPLVIVAAILLVVALVVGVGIWKFKSTEIVAPPPRPGDLGAMVEVAAGEFQFQGREHRVLPRFFIDKYKVTLAHYKEFLVAVAAGAQIEPHPFAPPNKDYRPANWEKMVEAIEQGKLFNDSRLSWDSPVFGVDFYDAYAYARWRGKRLPTEWEWEKAVLGGEPATVVPVRWVAVYAHPDDISPCGAVGMKGYVSEWTGTSPHRDMAIIRGGSWQQTDVPSALRREERNARDRSGEIGFRCAADKDVPPKL